MKQEIIHQLNKLRGQDLKARCARGSLALTLGVVVSKGLSFASKIILSHLLLKKEIGLVVMLLSLLSFFETIVEVGVKKSVVQSKYGDTPEYLNTAWWFQAARSVLLYLIAFTAAPWLSRFYFSGKSEVLQIYSVDELCTLMRVVFLYSLMNGFTSPRLHLLVREFRFFKRVFLTYGSAATGIVITIILAYTMQNVWAIAIGNTVGAAILLIFSFILCPFKPRFSIHRESLTDLLKYARGMIGLPILTYFAFNTDYLVLGKVMETSMVGMYGFAMVIANIPRDLFIRIINPVLLPAYAVKQSNKQTICWGVVTLAKTMAILTFPGVVFAVACGKTLLTVIYSSDYASVSATFSVMCLYIAIVVQVVPLEQVFYGIGQPGKERIFVIFRTLLIAAMIYPAIQLFGLTGAVGTLLIANLAGLALKLWLLKGSINLKTIDYAAAWLPGMITAVIYALILMMIFLLCPDRQYIRLILGLIACIGMIAVVLYSQYKKGAFAFKNQGLDSINKQNSIN